MCDNSAGGFDAFVKLVVDPNGQRARAVAWVFVRSGDRFTVTGLGPGSYSTYYQDLSSAATDKSPAFQLEQDDTGYSVYRITLYKLVDGNVLMQTIDREEFDSVDDAAISPANVPTSDARPNDFAKHGSIVMSRDLDTRRKIAFGPVWLPLPSRAVVRWMVGLISAILTPPASIAGDSAASTVYRLSAPSVVMIETYQSVTRDGEVVRASKPVLQGSGVVVAKGVVLSNCHVVGAGPYWTVTHDGQKYDDAQMLDMDPERDLCTISVRGLRAPAAHDRGGTPAIGEHVYSIGAPQGLELTIAEGIVSGLRKESAGTIIQTSAQISPGSSGGGLFDNTGDLVGITTFHLAGGNDLNFALPTSWIGELGPRSANFRARRRADFLKFQPACTEAIYTNKDSTADRIGHEWTAKEPYDARAWSCLGDATVLSDFKTSVAAYERSLELYPAVDTYRNLIRAYGMNALSLESKGDTAPSYYYERAVQAFNSAKEIDHGNIDLWVAIAKVANLVRPKDAVGYSKRALEIDNNSSEAWSELADAYNQIDRPKEAAYAARKAIDIDPDTDAWQVLASAAEALGDGKLAAYAHSEAKARINRMAEKVRRDAQK